MKLTQKFCEVADKGIYWDDQLPGFGLRVHAKTKTFILFIRDRDKRKRQTIVGHFPEVSLVEARAKARAKKQGESLPQSCTLTVSSACDFFLHNYADLYSRSSRDRARILAKYVRPVLGPIPLAKLTVRACTDLHRSLSVHPVQANRALSLLRTVINYCIKQGVYTGHNPVIGVMMNKERPRDRYYDQSEILNTQAALKSLAENPETYLQACAIYALMLTGCRKLEILSLEWSHINFAEATISLLRTKTGVPRALAMSDKCIELFKSMYARSSGSPFVFPSRSKTGHLMDVRRTWNRIRSIAKLSNAHIHDLRATLITHLQLLGIPQYLAGKTVGQKSIKATQVYTRSSTELERDALNRYSQVVIKERNGMH